MSLNDATRKGEFVAETLERVSMYPAPDASSAPFDFFWDGVRVPAVPWDAAGEWVLSSYGGRAAFLPARSVQLIPRDDMWARAQSCSSPTSYLIMVDTSKHKVGVFTGSRYSWTRLFDWDCTNGAAETPTVKGVFSIGIRGYYFDSFGSRCYWYTQFYGDYLFHSVLYWPNGSLMDGRLGMALSHGCVRLKIENAEWIYDNVPSGTTVIVY